MWLCGPLLLGEPTMKKSCLFCVILALMLSITVPALASDGGPQTEITALCLLPEISVIVPASAEVFINPYEIPIDIGSTASTAQIISTPVCIENRSEVPLDVGVTAVATEQEGSGSLLLAGSPTGGTGAIKRVFIYFEMQTSNTATPPQSIWDAEFDSAKHLVVRNFEMPARKMVTLSAVDGDSRFGAFRLAGDCSANPVVDPWTEEDGINVKISFTFTPLPRPGV